MVNDQLDAQLFSVYLFNSLHVSSNLVLIIRRINCINTTFGVCHSVSVTISCAVQKVSEISDLHKKRSPTQTDIYQMLYWYSWFSWWWARYCSKHVENWNKHIEKNCASSWSFTKNHKYMFSVKNNNILFLTYWQQGSVIRPSSGHFYIQFKTVYTYWTLISCRMGQKIQNFCCFWNIRMWLGTLCIGLHACAITYQPEKVSSLWGIFMLVLGWKSRLEPRSKQDGPRYGGRYEHAGTATSRDSRHLLWWGDRHGGHIHQRGANCRPSRCQRWQAQVFEEFTWPWENSVPMGWHIVCW